MPFGTVISFYLGSHFTRKELGEIFFYSSGDAVLLILLKYQEMDVQIQTFTDKDWNTIQSYPFKWY